MPSQPTVPRALHAAAAWHRAGWTPLMYAAAHGHTDAVELLVRMGATVNERSMFG